MVRRLGLLGVGAAVLWLGGGCQVNHETKEIRSDEQMLEVSFENARAEDLFIEAAKTTYGEPRSVKRVGAGGLSLYSRDEELAWNANCNDHLRKMDADANLIITEQEAQTYYDSLTPQ